MKKMLFLLLLILSFNFYGSEVKNFTLPIFQSDQVFVLDKEIKKYDKVLFNFWASWCTACIQELPELESLKEASKDKKILFVAINAGEIKKKIKKFVKKYKFSYLILEDKDRIFSKSLGVTSLPQTIVIDKSKTVTFKGNRPPKRI